MTHVPGLQAVIGLTGIMSYPRLTAFVLWLTGHQFRMANVKQAILDNAETASWWACMGLQALRCPFCGMVLMVFMPGMQVVLAFLEYSLFAYILFAYLACIHLTCMRLFAQHVMA